MELNYTNINNYNSGGDKIRGSYKGSSVNSNSTNKYINSYKTNTNRYT